MGYILFFIELVVLYFLARYISRNLFKSLYNNTQSIKLSTTAIAIIYFPGVLVHELAHVFAAMVLGVRVSHIEFWPSFSEGNLKLGSVRIDKTDPLRKTIIGVAPVLAGIAVILSSLWAVSVIFANSAIWLILTGIFVYQVGSTMFSSKKDLEGTRIIIIALLILFVLLWYFNFPFASYFFGTEAGSYIEGLFIKASYFLGIAVGINAFIATLIIVLQKIRRE